jgi:hypothetical protein
MDAELWGQIKEIYYRALEFHGDEREGVLVEACGDDADLRREVESLLAAHAEAGTFLQSPTIKVAAQEIVADEFTSTAIECGQNIFLQQSPIPAFRGSKIRRNNVVARFETVRRLKVRLVAGTQAAPSQIRREMARDLLPIHARRSAHLDKSAPTESV